MSGTPELQLRISGSLVSSNTCIVQAPEKWGSWEKAGDSGARWLLLLPLQGNVWCCVIQHTQPNCSHIKLREKCLVSLIASCYYAELINCNNPAHTQDNILRLQWKGFPPKNRLIHITTVFLNAPFRKTRFLDCCHYCFCNFHGYYIYFISQITEPMSEWYPLTLFFWRSYSFCLFENFILPAISLGMTTPMSIQWQLVDYVLLTTTWYFTNKLQRQLLQVLLLVFYPEKVDLNFLPKAG